MRREIILLILLTGFVLIAGAYAESSSFVTTQYYDPGTNPYSAEYSSIHASPSSGNTETEGFFDLMVSF